MFSATPFRVTNAHFKSSTTNLLFDLLFVLYAHGYCMDDSKAHAMNEITKLLVILPC